MPLFFDKKLNAWCIVHNDEKIITSNHDLEIMEGRISKEEEYLHQIISSAELILDDLDQGASVSQASFNLLGYADGIMLRIQKDVGKENTPTNIKDDSVGE